MDEGLVPGIGGDVCAGPERFEIGGKGGLSGLVEPAEGDVGGTEVRTKEGDGAGRIGGEVEVERDDLGLDAGEVRGEPLADDVLSPQSTGAGRADGGTPWRLLTLNS